MKSFIGIGTAFSWFMVCVGAALVLLVIAVVYNGLIYLKNAFKIGKLEFLSFKIAK